MHVLNDQTLHMHVQMIYTIEICVGVHSIVKFLHKTSPN